MTPSLDFDALFREHNAALVQAMNHRFRRDGEDIAQMAWALAWRHKDKFRGDSTFRTWLMKIALHAGIVHVSRSSDAKHRRNEEGMTFAAEARAVTYMDPERILSAKQELDAATRAIRPGHMHVYRMVFIYGMSYGDAAEALGKSVYGVKDRVHQLRLAARGMRK